jgi:anti-repressor protein
MELLLFKNENFNDIRVFEIEGNHYFVGRDIATALGYEKPHNAISQHVDIQDTLKQGIPDSQGFIQDTTLVNESGMFALIFGSKLDRAKVFKRWVTSEVLPSIRRTGGYITDKKDETPEELMARVVIMANETLARRQIRISQLEEENSKQAVQIESQKKQIEIQAPKALFADAVATSERSVLVSELAKIITQNGIEIGQNRMFEWLRKNGYLLKKGDYYNQPSQKAMESGLFELKKTTIVKPNGDVITSTTPKITGYGQIYFVNKFLSKCNDI